MAKLKGTNKVQIEGELKKGEGVQIDKETKYEYGATLQTEGVPLIDPGIGKTIALRTFTFKINPERQQYFYPEKQVLFNEHAPQISHILWGDGLRPFDGASPRVIINRDKGFYKIIVPCEARRDVLWGEKPKNLTQELMRKHDSAKK